MQKHRARKRAVIAAAATAAIGPVAVPLVIPDTAAAKPGYCPGNSLCLYRDPGFAGTIGWFQGKDNSYTDNTFVNGQPLNDKVSAVWNNTSRWAELCVGAAHNACGAGDGGRNFCMGPGVAISNLSNPPNFNEQLSSHAFYGSLSASMGCNYVVQGPQGCSI